MATPASSTAVRNREIKKVLENAFGKGKVRVRGDRGTAYGWVNVKIDWTPLDMEKAREMQGLVWELLCKAGPGKQIGTYGYDDLGSDYGHGNEISIKFNDAKFYRTQRMNDGTVVGLKDWSTQEWVAV